LAEFRSELGLDFRLVEISTDILRFFLGCTEPEALNSGLGECSTRFRLDSANANDDGFASCLDAEVVERVLELEEYMERFEVSEPLRAEGAAGEPRVNEIKWIAMMKNIHLRPGFFI
jgi:hypothetical protein